MEEMTTIIGPEFPVRTWWNYMVSHSNLRSDVNINERMIESSEINVDLTAVGGNQNIPFRPVCLALSGPHRQQLRESYKTALGYWGVYFKHNC